MERRRLDPARGPLISLTPLRQYVYKTPVLSLSRATGSGTCQQSLFLHKPKRLFRVPGRECLKLRPIAVTAARTRRAITGGVRGPRRIVPRQTEYDAGATLGADAGSSRLAQHIRT